MSGLKKNLKSLSLDERRSMVNTKEKYLSIRDQCRLLDLNRSSLYYKAVLVSDEEQNLMNRLDEIFTMYPFYGSRRLMVSLQAECFDVGRDHIRTLMKGMGLAAIYPKRSLSLRDESHKIYPYLLSDFVNTSPLQVGVLTLRTYG